MTVPTGIEADVAPLLETRQEALQCPHRYFATLRDVGPVVWLEGVGAYAVTTYDETMEVLRDPGTFSSLLATGPTMAAQTLGVLQEVMAEHPDLQARMADSPMVQHTSVLLNADPPAHDRQRALVNRAFSPRRVRQMEEPIAGIAHDLVDRFAGRGRCEFVREFAVALPLTVIAGALGVPGDDLPTFKRWSDDFVVAIGNHRLGKDSLRRMIESQFEFFDYFTEKIRERQARPEDDLITDVVEARIDGTEPLSVPEMLMMLSQFLVAGNETTAKLLASAMLRLARDPRMAQEVRGAPDAVAGFAEEALRLDAPVQGLFRMVMRDVTLAGQKIAAGSHLWLLYASANRDPAEFAEPDDVVLARENGKAHLSFGQGTHYCLGASLARAEARIGISTVLERLDGIRLADDAIEYEESYVLHGLKELHLEFEARTGGLEAVERTC